MKPVTRRFMIALAAVCMLTATALAYASLRALESAADDAMKASEFRVFRTWVEKEFAELRLQLRDAKDKVEKVEEKVK